MVSIVGVCEANSNRQCRHGNKVLSLKTDAEFHRIIPPNGGAAQGYGGHNLKC